jgi:hypothetical protein
MFSHFFADLLDPVELKVTTLALRANSNRCHRSDTEAIEGTYVRSNAGLEPWHAYA